MATRCGRDDKWEVVGPGGAVIHRPCAWFRDALELSPVATEFEAAGLSQRILHSLQSEATPLTIRVCELQQGSGWGRCAPDYFEDVQRLHYLACAVTHHLSGLIEQIQAAIELATRTLRIPGGSFESERFALANAFGHYIEFEALLAAVFRAFEGSRHSLAKLYRRDDTLPSNFSDTVRHLDLPKPLASHSCRALDVYAQVREYRHCDQHYAQFGARLPFALVELYKGEVFSVRSRIPDNPEVRSHKKFKFEKGLDALRFGWEAACGVVDWLEQLVLSLPARESGS